MDATEAVVHHTANNGAVLGIIALPGSGGRGGGGGGGDGLGAIAALTIY